ncbi:MAG: GxxExxY protein [Clostridium sp.]
MEEFKEFFDNKIGIGKSFNTTGVCVEEKHYMVNINEKLKEIIKLIQQDKYFVINKPRQYGKTTTLNRLYKILKSRYKVLKLDFEVMASSFKEEELFCEVMRLKISKCINYEIEKVDTLYHLSNVISRITENEEVILIIDEVDKISNNKLFLDFLGVLRSLFLERAVGETTTFKSVILAGVHDIRNLKLKFRDGTDTRYNSPWNIAVNFNVDMSFNSFEIGTMIEEYKKDNNLTFNVEKISGEIYKYTNGYPYLVSRVCQIIDEDIHKDKADWTIQDVLKGVKILISERNPLIDDLIKNLENNKELFEYIYEILVLGAQKVYNINEPNIDKGTMFGYFIKNKDGIVEVSNQIFKEIIYNYMTSKIKNRVMENYNFKNNFITEDNGLNIEKILKKFQQFMKENYSSRDKEFLERQGVLLFLAFIKPIINGIGFEYREVQISEEKRLDIVISYNQHKYIIETKIWYGEIAHKKGIQQLYDYLEIEGIDEGYLLIFNFNKNKEYVQNCQMIEGKIIFEVFV